jgi:basic amino acid/polyamine antiporter, APA family
VSDAPVAATGRAAQRGGASGGMPTGRGENLLERRLGVWSTAALLIGITIGSGIFRVPSVAAAEAGTLASVGLLWLAGGMVALFGALTLAELATLFPHSGGIYVFLREAYGPLPAFLFGWTRLLVIQPSSLGAIAMIFAAYLAPLLGLDDAAVRWLAAGAIALLCAANTYSLGIGAFVQNASTAAKVVALAGLVCAVFLFGDAGSGAFAAPGALAPLSWAGFGVALISVMWTYDGWADATYIAGEVRDPGRTMPRALIAGVLAIVVIYLAVNAAYLLVLPLDAMAASELVAADAAVRVFGTAGTVLVSALVVLSTFGSLNGAVMTGPRVLFALADDGLFFRPIAAVHPQWRTPHAAILLAGLLGIAYVAVRTFEQLAASFILGIWPFYVLSVLAVFVLRRRHPDLPRPYRTWGYPVVPVLFLLASLAMLGNALVTQPGPTLFGFGVILSGVPVYYVWRRLGNRNR